MPEHELSLPPFSLGPQYHPPNSRLRFLTCHSLTHRENVAQHRQSLKHGPAQTVPTLHSKDQAAIAVLSQSWRLTLQVCLDGTVGPTQVRGGDP